MLDRAQERAERHREHIAELNKRAAGTDLRLKRLYDAIETGIANLDDPALKDHIADFKAARDQDQAMLESSGQQTVTPAMVRKFARTARELIRIDGPRSPAATGPAGRSCGRPSSHDGMEG